jgi:hypothetical protein
MFQVLLGPSPMRSATQKDKFVQIFSSKMRLEVVLYERCHRWHFHVEDRQTSVLMESWKIAKGQEQLVWHGSRDYTFDQAGLFPLLLLLLRTCSNVVSFSEFN